MQWRAKVELWRWTGVPEEDGAKGRMGKVDWEHQITKYKNEMNSRYIDMESKPCHVVGVDRKELSYSFLFRSYGKNTIIRCKFGCMKEAQMRDLLEKKVTGRMWCLWTQLKLGGRLW